MINVYNRFIEKYQQVMKENAGRQITGKELILFGTLENLLFFEFMEKYVKNFDHLKTSYINPNEEFRLRRGDLLSSARFFRGTNKTYIDRSGEYSITPDHETSWSYSPYEASDWLEMQKNPKGKGIIIVSDFRALRNKGSIRQAYAGVFVLNAERKERIKPIHLLYVTGEVLKDREFSTVRSVEERKCH